MSSSTSRLYWTLLFGAPGGRSVAQETRCDQVPIQLPFGLPFCIPLEYTNRPILSKNGAGRNRLSAVVLPRAPQYRALGRLLKKR